VIVNSVEFPMVGRL